jgi:hypothetical protein
LYAANLETGSSTKLESSKRGKDREIDKAEARLRQIEEEEIEVGAEEDEEHEEDGPSTIVEHRMYRIFLKFYLGHLSQLYLRSISRRGAKSKALSQTF